MKTSFLSSIAVTAVCVAGMSVSNAAEIRMQHLEGAQKLELPSMNVEGTNAFLRDLVGNSDKPAPITCGLFRMEKGKHLTYTYDYDEAKIILDGSMTVSDGNTTVTAKAGDVLYFPKGATIEFSSESSGLGFICGNREFGGA
jgi:ethanolamine utilization protein EutQ (cupin superfamily)